MRPLYRICSTLTLLAACLVLPGLAAGQTILDLTTADSGADHNGALILQGEGGGSSGTGIFDPFYRVKSASSSDVQGVNTGNSTVQFETEKGTWTTELLLSVVTQVDVGGVLFREFFLDINQTQGNAIYDLTNIQVFTDDQPDLNCLTAGAPSTWGACDTDGVDDLVWWLDEDLGGGFPQTTGDATVRMDYTLEAGSGKRDIRLLVPDAAFGAGPECDYGQAGCGLYVYVYSRFEGNDDGFEEWSTAIQPFVQISKTATGTLDETTDWTIDKSVNIAQWDMFTGDTGTSKYTITVDKTVTQGNIEVTGTITLHVPDKLPDGDENSANAEVTALTDLFEGIPASSITCSAGPVPFTISGGETVTCDYVIDLVSEVTGTNTATASVTDRDGSPRPFVATANVASYTVTPLGEPGTINVSDTNGPTFGPFSDDGQVMYEVTFACDADEGTNPNTATIDETGDSDDASVQVNCYSPTVTKTVDTALERTYTWTVGKSVSPDQWDLFDGDSGTSDYTVDVTRSSSDGSFVVSGTITVTNDAPIDATINSVSDLVSPDIAGTVDCGGAGPYVVSSGGGTLNCTYSAAVPDASSRTNTATATLQNTDTASNGTTSNGGTTDFDSAAEDVVFDGSTTVVEIDETATVTDDWATPGDVGDDQAWNFGGDGQQTYSLVFECGADEGTRTNSVVIVGDDTGTEFDSDDAAVVVNCYDITVAKDAATAYTVTSTWDIEKTATPDDIDLFVGDEQEVKYTITLDETETSDDWEVSGTITISNPNPVRAADLTAITDVIDTFGAVTVDCGGASSVPADDSILCSYSAGPVSSPDANPFGELNTATATLQNYDYASDGTATPGGTRDVDGTAAVDFGSADVTYVNPEVNVTDSNGEIFGPFSGDDMVMYTRDFVCGGDEGEHVNTATIDETGASDDASVLLECWDIDVTKTAQPYQTENYTWEISKSVNPESWDLFTGDTGTSKYTIEVTRSEAPASDFRVEGTITVSLEPGTPIDAVINSVADLVSPDIAGTVDCGGAGPYDLISGGSDLECTYFTDLPDDATRTNEAVATQQNFAYAFDGVQSDNGTTDYSGTAAVDFASAIIVTGADATATATDDLGTASTGDDVSWGFGGSGMEMYERTFDCGDAGTNVNTVVLVGDDTGLVLDSDDATVDIACYDLVVTKDASTTYTREYDWDIVKEAFELGYVEGDDPVTSLTLIPGSIFTVVYKIAVDLVGYTDSDWAVSGAIEVSNPAPVDAMINDVADLITLGDIDGTPDCGVGFPTTIVAGGTLDCTYAADLPGADDRTNTATATLQNKAYHHTDPPVNLGTTDYQGQADIAFGAPTTVLDECTVVTDPMAPANPLGTACIDEDLPKSFTYAFDIQPTVADCDGLIIQNTATQTEEDTSESTDDTWTITVDVPCEDGCTLTQGYWKTHNASFWGGASKKADPTWMLIGDQDGDGTEEFENEEFFLSGQTWFDVFWTAPKGNHYYTAAHQWMAAYLNMLAGASTAADVGGGQTVGDVIDDGTALFEACEPGDVSPNDPVCKRRDFQTVNSILSSYNEGDIGPGHCDENNPEAFTSLLASVAGSVEAAIALEAVDQVSDADADQAGLDLVEEGAVADVRATEVQDSDRVYTEDEAYQAARVDEVEMREIEEIAPVEIPDDFAVGNYPNPFNPTTTIQVAVPEASHVRVAVYDMLGRLVTTLVDGSLSAGTHSVTFDASSLPSGVYLYRFEYSGGAITKTMQLLK